MVSPGAKVTLPDAEMKSAPASATIGLPMSTVAQSMVTASDDAGDISTGSCQIEDPVLPW
jgi:hypothetical protein